MTTKRNQHLNRPVRLIDQATGDELNFKSRSEASRTIGVTPGYLYLMMRVGIAYKGYKAFDLATGHKPRPKSKLAKPVQIIDPDGNVLRFDSRLDAGVHIGVATGNVAAAIINGWKLRGYSVEDIPE